MFFQHMSSFKPVLPTVEKPIVQSPWASQIKDLYSDKIKYAHNSIRNPIYPKKTVKNSDSAAHRTKFTIIGDRVTREFVYCANLVRGLHKYRKKRFETPDIRGVTTVEWPSILNDLKIRFGGLAFCLTSSVAILINNEFLGGEKELKELVETKYIYHLWPDYYKEAVAEFAKFITASGRPCAYMNIAVEDKHIGTLIFMLYSDIVPNTCENFLRLCKETRGGYSGTPIHRIVKDGWIQGGGFALKNTDLDCENFIVPHDRRGVLCMANDGRHVDCSTQFFVLLQPAPWMAGKYVAFGQLIEGKRTLEKIEAVPTWYEAPTSQITIYQAGILNMECQGIMITKGTNEYIDGHIEDLNALGELLFGILLEKVYLTVELREVERLKEIDGEGADLEDEDDGVASVRETQRFNRKKEDIEKQLQSSKVDTRQTAFPSVSERPQSASADNRDFDVETYEPEFEVEETDYVHQSIHTPSLLVKPETPYYIPLTDMPYPGEKDSDFNLRRFLQGAYCLEGDLEINPKRLVRHQQRISYASVMLSLEEDESESEGDEDLDSYDEKEIQKYLKLHSDRVSFAGDVIKKIAKGFAKLDLRSDARKSELITDEQLRRLRVASVDYRAREHHEKKVSISHNLPKEHHSKIKRRQTGFVHPEDLVKIQMLRKASVDVDKDDEDDNDDDDGYNEEDDDGGGNRKVRIADTATGPGHGVASGRRATGFVRACDVDLNDDDDDDGNGTDIPQKVRIADTVTGPGHGVASGRRATGFVRACDVDVDEEESDKEVRQSVLVRLFDDVKRNDEPPTLKDYKPASESNQKNILLKFSSNYRIKSDESTREKYRHSLTVERSYEDVLNLQHGKKVARKISSDYVKTIDQMEHKLENSIRSVEFAKTRPAMSVAEYQMRNKKYKESLKLADDTQSVKNDAPIAKRGLRLPGDSPLYSTVSTLDVTENADQAKLFL